MRWLDGKLAKKQFQMFGKNVSSQNIEGKVDRGTFSSSLLSHAHESESWLISASEK